LVVMICSLLHKKTQKYPQPCRLQKAGTMPWALEKAL
jgi:hypothetical protein